MKSELGQEDRKNGGWCKDGVDEGQLGFCFELLQNTQTDTVHVEVDWQFGR